MLDCKSWAKRQQNSRRNLLGHDRSCFVVPRSLPGIYSCSRIANCRFPRFFYTEPDLHARSALMREHISFRAFSAEPEMLYARWFCGRLWISRIDSNQSAFAVVKRQAAVGIQASLEHTPLL